MIFCVHPFFFVCAILLSLQATWKEMYKSTDNSINKGREKENSPKNEEISGRKYTRTPTHGNLKYLGDHRCLSQSEECKCMWTCSKDGIRMSDFERCHQAVARQEAGKGLHSNPYPSPLPVSQPPGGSFQNHVDAIFTAWFTYIYSLLIEKDICDRRNILSLHVFLFVCTFIPLFW